MIAPYYHSDRVTLYNADCIDVMRDMPDNSADLILTDPPYGIGITRNTKPVGVAPVTGRKATNLTWDDKPPDKRYFKEMFRISENQIIFGANYFWEHFYSSGCYIIWDKRGNMPPMPFCDTEFAWTSFVKKMSKRYVIVNHGFVRDSKDLRTGHPTQKPSELFNFIINDFSNPNDLIFDGFMGSGSTGVAAMKLNRRFIGIELSEEYCEIAKARIHAAELMAEADLFKPKG